MLQSFTHKPISKFSLWSRDMSPDYSHFVDGLSHAAYGSRAGRFIFERNNNSTLTRGHESNDAEELLRLIRDPNGLSRDDQIQDKMVLKRKTNNQLQDEENPSLDLNLSLQIVTQEHADTKHDASDLSLSLFSSNSTKNPSSLRRSKHAKIDEGNSSTTLDLTL
ncbi:hypothetical protein Hdeb2414_s0016g00497411 [Helianthus debilis subsp. tardiflorus]